MEEHRAKVKAYIKVTSWQYSWMLEYNGHRLYGEGEGSAHSVNRKLTAIEALADMLGHMNHETARILQQDAQEVYEQTHTREEWMERIGRNYKL